MWNKEVEDVYEEVDESEYKKRVESRLAEDDFIVDDGDGDYGGYQDHGGEVWDEDDGDFHGGDSSAARRGSLLCTSCYCRCHALETPDLEMPIA